MFSLRKQRPSAVRKSSLPVVLISTPVERSERVQDLLAEAQVEVELMKAQLERTTE